MSKKVAYKVNSIEEFKNVLDYLSKYKGATVDYHLGRSGSQVAYILHGGRIEWLSSTKVDAYKDNTQYLKEHNYTIVTDLHTIEIEMWEIDVATAEIEVARLKLARPKKKLDIPLLKARIVEFSNHLKSDKESFIHFGSRSMTSNQRNMNAHFEHYVTRLEKDFNEQITNLLNDIIED